jgi:DNA-binding MarR family transcriptional regulator
MNAPLPAADGRQSILELNRLIAVVRGFNRELEEVGERIMARHGLTPPQRSLLLALRKVRTCTVPQLARRREVSRQYVQVTMNALAQRGLVAFQANPEHKRSRLLVLTDRGEALLLAVMAREGEVLQRVAARLDPQEARVAVRALELAGKGLAATEL